MPRAGGLDRARTGCTLVAEWPLAVWAESRPARRQPGEQRCSDARGRRQRNRFRRRRRDRDRAAAPPRAAAALRSPVRLPAGGGGGDRREPGQPVAHRRWRGDRARRRRTGAHPRPAQRLSRRSRAELRRLPLPGARRARRRAADGGRAPLRRPALRPPRRARTDATGSSTGSGSTTTPRTCFGFGMHEGDWEMVQIGLGTRRAAGATRLRPARLAARRARRRGRVGRARRRTAPGRLRRAALPRLLLRGRHPSLSDRHRPSRTETGPRLGCRSSGSAIG